MSLEILSSIKWAWTHEEYGPIWFGGKGLGLHSSGETACL
jgi:hypothetical protein